jgi:hypothetical protein
MGEQIAGHRAPIARARLRPDPNPTLTGIPLNIVDQVQARLRGDLVPREQLIQAFNWKSLVTYYAYCRQGMPYVLIGNKRFHSPEAVREWFVARQADRTPRRVGRPRTK